MEPKPARAGPPTGIASLIGRCLTFRAAAWATAHPQPHASDGPKDCTVGALSDPQSLSREEPEFGQAPFLMPCGRSAAILMNGGDARLDGRLERPTPRKSPSDPDLRHPLATPAQGRVSGTATLAPILGIDGEVSWDAVRDSTADKEVTDPAPPTLRSAIFSKPATLDGKPLRVYDTTGCGHSDAR